MAAVVKSRYGKVYYNVQAIDDVIAAGKWIAAPSVRFAGGAHGRLGIEAKHVDWTVTARRK